MKTIKRLTDEQRAELSDGVALVADGRTMLREGAHLLQKGEREIGTRLMAMYPEIEKAEFRYNPESGEIEINLNPRGVAHPHETPQK